MTGFNDQSLKEAVIKADLYYLNTLPIEEKIIHRFSREFEEKMKALIRRAQKKRDAPRVILLRRRIAILVASIVILASAMSVSAVRSAVIEFITHIYERFTSISFNTSQSAASGEFEYRRPAYIPAGFELTEEDNRGRYLLNYTNDDEWILYQQNELENVSLNINTEGIILEETKIDQTPAKYYSNQGKQYLLWHDASYVYSVSTTLSREETFKIAESIGK